MTVTDAEKEKIYLDYQKKILGYLYGKVPSRETAEDLCSAVFVKIYERLDSFDESTSSLSTWIYAITRNTVIDFYRTQHAASEIPETLDDGSSLEDELCSTEMLDRLAEALKQLDERQRDIIILHYYGGKTLREISVQLGISYTYTKVLQSKALNALKIFLE